MAILSIKVYPDPVLKTKTEKVKEFGSKIQKLIDDMIETMFQADGVGLAAPQVGISKKIAVLAPSGKKGKIFTLVNPEITSQAGSFAGEEGCLSLPGLSAEIFRAQSVTLHYQDRTGKPHEIEAKDFFARVIQHELDHLNGLLLIDRVEFNKRQELLAQYQSSANA